MSDGCFLLMVFIFFCVGWARAFSLIAIGDDVLRCNANMFHLRFGGMFVLDSIPVCIFQIANNTDCSFWC